MDKGRLKAKRDLQTLETLRDQWQQRYPEDEHRLDVVSRERDEARRKTGKRGLAERVRRSQRLVKRAVDGVEDLAGRSLD